METRNEALVIAYSAGLDEERDMDCGEGCWPGESLGQHGDLIPDADSTCRLVRPRQRSRITNARIGTRGEAESGVGKVGGDGGGVAIVVRPRRSEREEGA
jgi:hypothetical protein